MNIDYCEKWFQSGKRPIKPFSAAEARRRHDTREPYCALIGGGEAPTRIISLAGKWVSVGFIDVAGREYLTYDFHEKQAGRLFLTHAHYREFEGAAVDPFTYLVFAFKQSGNLIMEHRDLRSGEVKESERTVDVTPNWDDYPAFGEYASLIREERELAVSH